LGTDVNLVVGANGSADCRNLLAGLEGGGDAILVVKEESAKVVDGNVSIRDLRAHRAAGSLQMVGVEV